MYSDGDRYLPAVAAVNALKDHLPAVENVLVLGTGLGSMVRVITVKGYSPHYTLVEKDKIVLEWALEFMDAENVKRTEPVCMDAKVYVGQNRKKYDFIFVDIFNGRVVPEFVISSDFLSLCRDSLSPGGHVAFNYIVNNNEEWLKVQNIFDLIFPGYRVITMGINRILINTQNR